MVGTRELTALFWHEGESPTKSGNTLMVRDIV
jgi:hypothetical protein